MNREQGSGKTSLTDYECGILFPMSKKKGWASNLEVYAFWTGFLSTIISLLQVIVIALKK